MMGLKFIFNFWTNASFMKLLNKQTKIQNCETTAENKIFSKVDIIYIFKTTMYQMTI